MIFPENFSFSCYISMKYLLSGVHMDFFMHLTHRHCIKTLICILVSRFFSNILLILSFIQCDKDLSFYIIIFYWFYVLKIMKIVFS